MKHSRAVMPTLVASAGLPPALALDDFGALNDRPSSIVAHEERREGCANSNRRIRYVVLRPRNYPTLRPIGLDNGLLSARSIRWSTWIDESRYASVASDEYRGCDHAPVREVDVTVVCVVVGPPWIVREQVVQNGGNTSLPGAIAGAVIGAILGHQVGGSHGEDAATTRSYGANIVPSAGGKSVSIRDKLKDAALQPDSHVHYRDVTYNFRGPERRVQMTQPPGPTLLVDAQVVRRAQRRATRPSTYALDRRAITRVCRPVVRFRRRPR